MKEQPNFTYSPVGKAFGEQIKTIEDEFEKWRAFRASVRGEGDVGGVLAWVACLHEWRASVGGMFAWVAWVAYLRGCCASMGGVGSVLLWVAH